jgi:hypothetical protein
LRFPARRGVCGHRFQDFRAACLAARFPHGMRGFAAFLQCGRLWSPLFRRFGFRFGGR